MTTAAEPDDVSRPQHAWAFDGLAPSQARQMLRTTVLVLVAAVCLTAAVSSIRGALDTLYSSTSGAGVEAGAGIDGAAARRNAITGAVVIGGVALLIAALTEWILPRPLGLLRGVDHRRFVGGAAGAAARYLALLFLAGKLATTTIPAARPYPGSAIADPNLLTRDLFQAGATGMTEELLLFAVPLALLGMLENRRWAAWAGLVLVVTVRLGAHLYYGPGFAAVFVIPWIIGAWLMYRAIGSIWPLIIGHALYDAALFTAMRTGQAWASTALLAVASIGGVLLLATVRRWGRSARPATAGSPTPPIHR